MVTRTYIAESAATEEDAAELEHVNDDFDDVFGSAPGSPSLPSHGEDAPAGWKTGGNAEISDIHRLKEKHETEGYRDGVTKGKAESVQQGFDEGYSLGATLGLRIGKILGLLEGICHAVESAVRSTEDEGSGEWEMQRLRIESLWGKAREELRTESVFGRDWWGEDGIWTYEVEKEREGMEVLFPDVAAAHPLVVKWEKLVQEEIEKWDLDMGVMEHEDDEKDVGRVTKSARETNPASLAPGAAKELSW